MQCDSKKGVAEKCHLCYHRIDREEKLACVDKCIGRCIYFGTMEGLVGLLGDERWRFWGSGFLTLDNFSLINYKAREVEKWN